MRIRGYDEDTEQFTGDIEELTGKIADLTKTAKTPGGISLFTDASKTEYKSTYQLLKEISEIYHDLSDKNQAKLLETLAGKRGGQVLAGILDDFSEVEKAMYQMEHSLGSADAEMSIIQDSWEYKLNALKETWVGTLQAMIDRGDIAEIIDGLTAISEAIQDVINAVGGLPSIFSILAGGTLSFNKLGVFDVDGNKGIISSIMDMFSPQAEVAKKASLLNITPTEISAIQKWNEAIKNTDDVTEALDENLDNISDEVKDFVKESLEAGASSEDIAEGLNHIGSSSKIAAIGMQALNLALNVLISFAIAKGVELVYRFATAEKELAQNAKETAQAITSTRESISSYKSEVSKLSETLHDENATVDEKIEARKQLLDIQDKMIEQYGSENSAVMNINTIIETSTDTMLEHKDAIEKTAEAWKNLELASVEAIGRQSDAEDNWFTKFINKWKYGTESSFRANQKKYQSDNYSIQYSELNPFLIPKDEIKLNQYMASLGGNYGFTDMTFENKSAEEMLDIYEKVLAYAKSLEGINSSWLDDLQVKIDETKNLIEDTAEYRNYQTEQRIDSNKDYAKAKKEISEMYESYNEALASGDKLLAQTLELRISNALKDVQNKANQDGDILIADWFEHTYAEFQKKLDEQNIGKWLGQKTDSNNSSKGGSSGTFGIGITEPQTQGTRTNEDVINDYISRLNNISANDLREAYTLYDQNLLDSSNKWKDQKETVSQLFNFLRANNLEISTTIDYLEKQKKLTSDDLKTAKEKFALYTKTLDNGEVKTFERKAITEWLNGLSSDDLAILLTLKLDPNHRYLISELQAFLDEAKQFTDDNPIEVKVKTGKETVDSLKDTLKPGLDAVSNLWDEIFPKEGFSQENLKKVDIFSWIEKLEGITDKKGEELFKFDSSSIEEFIRLMNDSTSTAEDFKAVLDSMQDIVIKASVDGTEDFETLKTVLDNLYVDNSGLVAFTNTLSDSTNATKMFNEAGIEYQNIIYDSVTDTLKLVDANGDLVDSGEATLQAFINEKVGAEDADLALAQLKLAILTLNGTPLDTTADINALISLVEECGIAADALRTLNSLKNGQLSDTNISAMESKGGYQAAQAMKNARDSAVQAAKDTVEAAKNVKPEIDDTRKKTEQAAAATSGAGKAADKTKDEVEDLAKEIEELNSAYATLKEIAEEYNKTGKITFDQAKKLVDVDFRVLALLKKEGNQMKVNELETENLAQAEMIELKVALYRKAIALIDTLTSEAAAQEWLTHATFEGAEAGLAQVKVLYAEKIAALEAAGGYRALAAAKIEAALAGAEAMLENVDLSSFGINSESAGEVAHDAGEAVEDEFEKVFDWIERRIELLQKQIDYLTAKIDIANNKQDIKLLNQQQDVYIKKLKAQQNAEKAYAAERDKYMTELPEDIQQKILEGGEEIVTLQGKENEELADSIDKAIEFHDKMLDVRTAALETQKAISNISLEKIERYKAIMEEAAEWGNIQNGKLNSVLSKEEAHGNFIGGSVYKRQANIQLNYLYDTKGMVTEAANQLKKDVASGKIKPGTEDYDKALQNIYSLSDSMYEAAAAAEEYKQQQREANYALRDFKMSVRQSFRTELDNIQGLMREENMFKTNDKVNAIKVGNGTAQGNNPTNPFSSLQITNEGYALMGISEAKRKLAVNEVYQYKEALKDLEKQREKNQLGEKEYIEQKQQLTESMYASASAAKAEEDALIEYARKAIQEQINLINKQVEAYKELITKKKEALQAEKKLHDQRKQTKEANESIIKIERQLAAIANDQSLEGEAKRRKLESQLAEAKENKQETEYNQKYDTQIQALEDSVKQAEEEAKKQTEKLEEYSKNTTQLLKDTKTLIEAHPEQITKGTETALNHFHVTATEPIKNALTGEGGLVNNITSNVKDVISKIDDNMKAEDQRQKEMAQTIWKAKDDLKTFLKQQALVAEKQKAYDEAVAKYGKNSTEAKTAKKALDAQKKEAAAAEEKYNESESKALGQMGITSRTKKLYEEYQALQRKYRNAKSPEEYEKYYKAAREKFAEYSKARNQDFAAAGSISSNTAKNEENQINNLLNNVIPSLNNRIRELQNQLNSLNAQKRSAKTNKEKNAVEAQIQTIQSEIEGTKNQINSYLDQIEDLENTVLTKKSKQAKVTGYAKGAHKLKKDQIAWTQEYGTEAILSPTKGAVLTALSKGDSVLTAQETEQLYKLAKMDLSEIFQKMATVNTPNITPINTETSNTVNIDTLVRVEGSATDENVEKIKAVCERAIRQNLIKLRDGLHK